MDYLLWIVSNSSGTGDSLISYTRCVPPLGVSLPWVCPSPLGVSLPWVCPSPGCVPPLGVSLLPWVCPSSPGCVPPPLGVSLLPWVCPSSPGCVPPLGVSLPWVCPSPGCVPPLGVSLPQYMLLNIPWQIFTFSTMGCYSESCSSLLLEYTK